MIINRFRRNHILASTFLLLSVLFSVCGGTLIAAARSERDHVVTTVFYAISQFVFNLGPNTLIFVLAAEIFPTVYRGTFFGIAAASGKVGAIIIRAIIGRTKNLEMSLGIRLLVFIPFMLASALLSTLLPSVQYFVRTHDIETTRAQEEELETKNPPQVAHAPASVPNTGQLPTSEDQVQRASVDSSSSDGSSIRQRARPNSGQESPLEASFLKKFFGRLENKALEDIAPNPAWDNVRDGDTRKKAQDTTGSTQATAAQASGALPC
jgi:PHS family inorganic phosphate transporter-like MFS transporter